MERLRDQAQKKYEKTKNIVLEEENKLKTYKTQLTEIKAQILARDKEPFSKIFSRFDILDISMERNRLDISRNDQRN